MTARCRAFEPPLRLHSTCWVFYMRPMHNDTETTSPAKTSRQKPTSAERKAEQTDDAVRQILEREAEERDDKTARLRALRRDKEAGEPPAE